MDVRVIDKDKDPWFILIDVCKILDIKNSRDASSKLDEDEKNTVAITDGTDGNPQKTVINESGLYSLILRSRKPEAKQFKKWVTSELTNYKNLLGCKDIKNQNIIPFTFENTSVRVVNRDGEAWFVANDVASALGYSKPRNAISVHCKAAISIGALIQGSLDPQTKIIPERDVYRLVMRSKLPSALFKKIK